MPRPASQGFVYASFAEAYMDEAFASIATLLKHNPGANVCLLTAETLRPYYEQHYAHVPIDQVRYVPYPPDEPSCFFRTKLLALSPYQKTMALDADTYITADIQPLFDLLDTFDFAAVPDESHPARGFILGLKGGYAALNYYNCGVLLFRNSPASQELFENWRQEYLALAPLEPADQGPLVRALVKTNLRFITLPREYNLRLFSKCASFHGRAKIIHARAKDPDKLIRMVNDVDLVSQGSRVWIPNLQRVIRAQAFLRFGQWLQLLNLDNVQLPAAGQVQRRTIAQNLLSLGPRLASRLARLKPAMPATNGAISADDPVAPHEPLLAKLLREHQVRSVFVWAHREAPLVAYLKPQVARVFTLDEMPPRGERVDLVWVGGIREGMPHRRAQEFVEVMTRFAGRLIALYLIPATPLPPPRSHPDASLHLDWYWTQLVSDRRFYFDPHLTLACRRASQHEGFKRTGLVFEREPVQSVASAEEPCLTHAS